MQVRKCIPATNDSKSVPIAHSYGFWGDCICALKQYHCKKPEIKILLLWFHCFLAFWHCFHHSFLIISQHESPGCTQHAVVLSLLTTACCKSTALQMPLVISTTEKTSGPFRKLLTSVTPFYIHITWGTLWSAKTPPTCGLVSCDWHTWPFGSPERRTPYAGCISHSGMGPWWCRQLWTQNNNTENVEMSITPESFFI